MAHAIELERFSAFATLDATIEKHTGYKNKPKHYQRRQWGFGARLKHFTERAEQNDLLKKLSSASGYPIEELRDLCYSRPSNRTKHHWPLQRPHRTYGNVVFAYRPAAYSLGLSHNQ
jgi:hypothetical protein